VTGRYDPAFVTPDDIAAFDVDGTLTKRDCVLPFLVRVGGRARVAGVLARRAGLLAAARRDRARRDDVKAALSAAVLAGRPAGDVAEIGERFAGEIADRWIRDDVAARLAWHRDAGHEVVLVTASFALYAEPLGRRLGASRVMATELEVDRSGRLTGRLAGANCRGQEKVRRLAALYGDPPPLGWAYGDSPDDEPMLAQARHPVSIGPTALVAVPSSMGDA
jgi:phosphatidylglycerophosphatase C